MSTSRKRKIQTIEIDDIEDPMEQKSSNELLLQKYHPQTFLELAVHKKKLDQVRHWFLKLSTDPRILVLTGPSGCAKTTTVKVIAREMGYEINEFDTGINTNVFSSIDKKQYQSTSQKFCDYISACISSSSLQLVTGNTIIPKKNQIALIDDFPALTDGMKSIMHNCFRQYVAAYRVSSPIILILSDIQTIEESISQRPLNIREVLPVDVRNHFRVENIQFNSIAKTILIKAITRICELEFRGRPRLKPSKQMIEDICVNAQGDVRSAISSLQLFLLGKGDLGDAKRDHQVSLFSGLGKILYNKRKQTMLDCESVLLEELRRREMEFVPEKLFEALSMSAPMFLGYLHENYIQHCVDLEEFLSASEYQSQAEVFASTWDQYNQLQEYSSSIAIRGVMYSWNPTRTKKSSFSALAKPRLWTTQQKQRETQSNWNELLWKDAVEEYFLYQKTRVLENQYTPKEVVTELIPYLGLYNRFSNTLLLSIPQKNAIQEFCTYDTVQNQTTFMQNHIPEQETEIEMITTVPKKINDSIEFLNELKRAQQKSDWDGLYLLEDMIED